MCEDLYPQMNAAIYKAVAEKERLQKEAEEAWILENFDTFHFLQTQQLNLLERSFWTRLFLRTLAKMEFIEDFYIVAKSDILARAAGNTKESKVWKKIQNTNPQKAVALPCGVEVAYLLYNWWRNQ